MFIAIPTVAVLAAAVLLFPMLRGDSAVSSVLVKKRVLTNAGIFFGAAILLVVLGVCVSAEGPATATAAASAAETAGNSQGMGFLAAALSTGLSCLGAGIAIASTAPAAIGAFSENPKAFGKALIFVVLGEGVALYGLLISILLINKL